MNYAFEFYIIKYLFFYLWQGIDDKVIVEIFLEGGSEFTAIILDVGSGFDREPIVLLPTEVHILSLCIVIDISCTCWK